MWALTSESPSHRFVGRKDKYRMIRGVLRGKGNVGSYLRIPLPQICLDKGKRERLGDKRREEGNY